MTRRSITHRAPDAARGHSELYQLRKKWPIANPWYMPHRPAGSKLCIVSVREMNYLGWEIPTCCEEICGII